ncbi:MAG TPA: hypothetical protein VMW29_04200 [Candidatus Bathyarchaeia archaeon]|nr:hypothetical protein [Candidatus Bathyarchaeia archaeon]
MFLSILSFTFNAIIGFVEFVVGLRLALKIVGASTQAPFVAWVYRNSDAFITPFKGVFPNFKLAFIEIEPATILSFIVYGVVGLLINQVLTHTKQNSKKESGR